MDGSGELKAAQRQVEQLRTRLEDVQAERAALEVRLASLESLGVQLEDRRILMDAMEANHALAMREKEDEVGSLEKRIQALESRLRAFENAHPSPGQRPTVAPPSPRARRRPPETEGGS